MTENQEVLDFINKFKLYEQNNVLVDTFTKGLCYWFAYILSERFISEILYEPVEGHFLTMINGRYFDIRGDVTDDYERVPFVGVKEYMKIPNVVTGCILKVT